MDMFQQFWLFVSKNMSSLTPKPHQVVRYGAKLSISVFLQGCFDTKKYTKKTEIPCKTN